MPKYLVTVLVEYSGGCRVDAEVEADNEAEAIEKAITVAQDDDGFKGLEIEMFVSKYPPPTRKE